jgi:hypothetical protein
MRNVIYAECHKQALYAECRYAECRYAECRYAECQYTECRGAHFLPGPCTIKLFTGVVVAVS